MRPRELSGGGADHELSPAGGVAIRGGSQSQPEALQLAYGAAKTVVSISHEQIDLSLRQRSSIRAGSGSTSRRP